MGLPKPQAGEFWSRLASGIEAGIVGGIAMLALLVSESLWEGRVWWEVPNLLGSTFYGPRAFHSGASLATLSGTALHFVITGTLGGLFGLAFGRINERGRLILLGVLASVGWYNLANSIFWPRVNPWVLAASPRPGTVVSHVLLGACLGYMGQRHRPALPAFRVPDSAESAILDSPADHVLADALPVPTLPLPDQALAAELGPRADLGEPPAEAPSDALN